MSQSSATQFLEVKSVYSVCFCYLFTHYTLELVFTSSDFQMEKNKVTIAINTAPPVGQTSENMALVSCQNTSAAPLRALHLFPVSSNNAFLQFSLLGALCDAAETPTVRTRTILSDIRTLLPCDVSKETCLLQHIGLFVGFNSAKCLK